jgi:hypothetical protein
MVRMTNPINWIGFRPHESMKRKQTQYPGINPATDKMTFPTEMLKRVCHRYKPTLPTVEAAADPNPIPVKMIEEFNPRP